MDQLLFFRRYVKINLKEEYSDVCLDSDTCNGFTDKAEGKFSKDSYFD